MSKCAFITDDGWFIFHCPGCGYGHGVPITAADPKHWDWDGDAENPTLLPSLMVNRGRANPTRHQCHFFIKKGQIIYLDDCSHELKGRIVPLETKR